jgi:FkbM family methyltransferase
MDGVSAPLMLPRGAITVVTGDERDLTVLAVLRGLNGDWEPHIRRFLERTVRADWVCVDIGANIGTHTLAMASMATQGTVVAFEASPKSFGYLSRNIADLPAPKARVKLVNGALWSETGRLNLAVIAELPGCSFVTPSADVAKSEALLREVINPADVAGVELHVGIETVDAITLDAWVHENGLERIDLVKLDVEGAEARVLRGAEGVLRKHAPILITEYAPSCHRTVLGAEPQAYFTQLLNLFARVYIIEEDGSLSPIDEWATLSSRLETGKGWEDLACMPRDRRRSSLDTFISGLFRRS